MNTHAHAAEPDPDNVLNNRACLTKRPARLDKAEQALQRVPARDEARVYLHFNIASRLARTGRLPLAFEHFARQRSSRPDCAHTRTRGTTSCCARRQAASGRAVHP